MAGRTLAICAGAYVVACAPPGPVSLEACLTNRTESVVEFEMLSKPPNEGWTNASVEHERARAGARACFDAMDWPRSEDTAFVVDVAGSAIVGCGEINAGSAPDARELHLEFVDDSRLGAVCRMHRD